MVDHFFCLQLAAFESSLVILRAIFCVYKIVSLSWFLYHLNLGVLETQLSVLFGTSEDRAHTIEKEQTVEQCLWGMVPKNAFFLEHFLLFFSQWLCLAFT